MSRPVGKYFASIIAKIHALKAAESIEVDHNFKGHLRHELIRHIATMPKSSPAKSWSRLFRNFYQLAAVGAFLLVAVITIGIKKFTPSTSQPSMVAFVSTSTSVPQPSPTPSNTGDVSSGADITPPLVSPSSKHQPSSPENNASKGSPLMMIGPSLPQDTQNVQKSLPPTPNPSPIISPSSSPVGTTAMPAPQPSPEPTTPQSAASILPSTTPNPVVPSPATTSPNPVATSPSTEPTATTPTPSASTTPDTSTSTVPQPTFMVKKPSYELEFQGSFTDEQKKSIQDQIVTPLTQNKAINKVVVTSTGPDTISVQLFSRDTANPSQTFRYYFDYRSQKWIMIRG